MTQLFRGGDPVPLSSLGPLESQVLQALWTLGKSGGGAYAREVLDAIEQPLAYTTVTTTLDRLCKKNLLERSKVQRAFVYKPKYTRMQLDELEARRVISSFAGGGQLVSCLIDAVTRQDASLLDELEEKIRRRREDLKGGQA
ncbi:MAG: BlaI/MecI/CopY family transcriptional regulator [Bryobacteraceae bacterium]